MVLRSLQWRLVAILILLTVVLMIFVGVLLNKSVESMHYYTFKERVEVGFNNWGIKDMYNPGLDDLVNYLKNPRNAILDFSLTNKYKSYSIIDMDGKIIYSSDSGYKENGDKFKTEILKSENLLAVMAGKKLGDSRTHTNASGKAFFDYAKSIPLKDAEVILYFRYDKEDLIETIGSFNKVILSTLLIAIGASLVLGYILSKTITVPIVNIMHKAQKIASGDFEQVVESKSGDEIGKLTNTFNYMANELKNKLNEISREKNKVETILNYMTDGVIAFNLAGEVIHINPAAKKMLGVGEFNFTFNEFSKEYEMGAILEEIVFLEASGIADKTIDFNGKFIKAYFAVFTDVEKKAEGIITVLHDITEQQKLEDMRRDFVANVSHELRTPLTSIKSYAETLLDGALEDRETTERFLSVINSESDRMTRLVKDLLQLSSLDNQQLKWNMKELSLVDLVKSSVEKMQIEARNKGQQLESYVIGDIPDIKADRDRVEQVVLNILSNAIKYTPEGGKVTVYIGKMFNDAYFKVADTGIGIPKADLPRIFERFYRVDKARSREMGGTGLGLSIAREIVVAHGGNISVNSEIGEGTEVTVKLPICN